MPLLLVGFSLVLLATPAALTPPKGLACLVRFYGGKAVPSKTGWQYALPNGVEVPYDDGREKTLDEKDADADPEDMYFVRYRKGVIRPVKDPDDDPGRVRFDALFRATYGDSASRVDLVSVTFAGHRVRVHRKIQKPFERAALRVDAVLRADPTLEKYVHTLAGTFNWRNIAGTERLSSHSFGIAIDLDTRFSNYWRWQKAGTPWAWKNSMPQSIVDAFEAEGFIWGGRWYHFDTMHFEYRPELLDPSCEEGAGSLNGTSPDGN